MTRRLQWKLTATYLAITCIVALIAVVVPLGLSEGRVKVLYEIDAWFEDTYAPSVIEHLVLNGGQIADAVAPFERDVRTPNGDRVARFEVRRAFLISEQRERLDTMLADPTMDDQLPAVVREDVVDALAGRDDYGFEYGNGDLILLTARVDGIGAFIIEASWDADAAFVASGTLRTMREPLRAFLGPFALIVIIAGAVFGWWAARSLTRRLDRVDTAARAWASGDFSTLLNDASGDEVGQLARTLDTMAQQLEELIASRGRIAALEERNRLARDLHDTVKQQIFAANLQLASVHTLLDQDRDAARASLVEAESLTSKAAGDLTEILRALRPDILAGRSLDSALTSYARDWARRTSLALDIDISTLDELDTSTCEAVMRVEQEALSNIERHARARRAHIVASTTRDRVTLTIEDDGVGLSADAQEGLGRTAMRERIEHVGGTLTIEQSSLGGVRVSATVPRAQEDRS